jgi:hypothetical protein
VLNAEFQILTNFPDAGSGTEICSQITDMPERSRYTMFYPRIPQIYNSTIETDNGLTPNSIFLNRTASAAQQVFPPYPVSAGELRAAGAVLRRAVESCAVRRERYFGLCTQLPDARNPSGQRES